MKTVVLDSHPLGLICHPLKSAQSQQCEQWVLALLAAGHRVILPEIIDFEIRRDFERRNNVKSLNLLDQFGRTLEFLQLQSPMLRHAAVLWGQARNIGKPTASADALDIDVILAAQALSLNVPVIVATSNPTHLSLIVPAEHWELIAP
jgi:predicted nucleic acid-binding protein